MYRWGCSGCERETPSHASVTAVLTVAGCPRMPLGAPGVLWTDLAQDFVRTTRVWVVRRVG